MSGLTGARIHITGIVQGVGFRPFIYGLAERYALKGWVRNTSAGVDIEVDGTGEAIQQFTAALTSENPPLARIDDLQFHPREANGFTSFQIIHSQSNEDEFQPISPDVCVCSDCLEELFNPDDRRYNYPFINCTNCGPRFTIIKDIPYDRPKTTMAHFTLCDECADEYNDPLDRRFHAQPVACPQCGPKVWLETSDEIDFIRTNGLESANISGCEAIFELIQRLSDGQIIAIKGLGGFHLACDAKNHTAVAELRRRKLRVDKPFALMMADIVTIETHCYLNQAEQDLLLSRERPIVVLKRREKSTIAEDVAPRQDTLGVMLPYTPLHYLIFPDHYRHTGIVNNEKSTNLLDALVMTSGNLSEEPIAVTNEEARERLGGLADAFLMHNRPIRTRCDDSVVRVFGGISYQGSQAPRIDKNHQSTNTGTTYPLRRSRGYVPYPVYLPWRSPILLATGAELKNTFCITREKYAFLSQHIGDMENYETLQSFEEGIKHLENLFRVKPEAIAYDKHPDYLASRYALERAESEDLPSYGVQHHHAHIVSCMVEHNIPADEPVIGVSFDGTGYGDDGAIWGGEFLFVDYTGYRRYAHLAYIPLPGGDLAIRTPARIALAYLWQYDLEWDASLPPLRSISELELTALRSQLEYRVNTPLTSSMGRLFDAAAALAGVRQKVNYEAQAAIEFEALISRTREKNHNYRFEIRSNQSDPTGIQHKDDGYAQNIIHAEPLLRAIVEDIHNGTPANIISSRFHNGVAEMVHQVCIEMRSEFETNKIALSGGVWQNMALLNQTVDRLESDGFQVLLHSQVPTNDGGIALGQAVIALHKMKT